jgi:phosphatidylserine/phosphatidylglycerophosphate/cardiolipin synthase-like enzyme/uncharacterized membrane protein YdjX (TVP38/TMEM64 family)
MHNGVNPGHEPDPERTWKTAPATRVSLLVDADRYFTAFRRAALAAQRSMFILGWDVDTRTRLCGPEEPNDGYPAELLEFLHALLDARDELQIYVIAWDFAVIYALERETFPSYRFHKEGHPRLHYVLDSRHPTGASHHQKVVVIDDQVAFVGGLDLTIRRWDTPDHRTDNPRRVDPAGKPYSPFHDVQIAVQGPAARLLGELARHRLSRVSDVVVQAPREPDPSRKPLPIAGDVTIDDVSVSIVRTQPALDSEAAPIQEVLASTLHAIASARDLLYIENQYFTSAAITDALSARLKEADGPELIMVLPQMQSGWLERNSMGVLRQRALARLRAHDAHGRLHVYCALSDGACISVHSKLMIADDHILRVGSSNLSNRSMGLDTECDVVLEAQADDARAREGIRAVLCHLLGEHLGCPPQRVSELASDPRALVAFIDARKDGPRHLAPLDAAPQTSGGLAGLEDTIADPERPVALDDFVRELLPVRIDRPAPRSVLALLGFVLPLLFIAGVWQLDAVRDLASVEGMTRALRLLRQNPLGPLLVCSGFVLATQLFCPITLLISATAVAFEPVYGFAYALFSSVLSASTSYGLGRALAKRAPSQFATGQRMRRIRRQLKMRGFQATLAARLLPLGNFTMINLLAGMLRVPFLAFVAGNVVGLLPGVLGLTLLAHTLGDTLSAPSSKNWLLFAVCAVIVFGVLYGVSKLFLRRTGLLYTRKLGVVPKQAPELPRGAE